MRVDNDALRNKLNLVWVRLAAVRDGLPEGDALRPTLGNIVSSLSDAIDAHTEPLSEAPSEVKDV